MSSDLLDSSWALWGWATSGLVIRRVSLPAKEVVFAKGILEASEGVGVLFGERGGELIAATPPTRAFELDRVLADLRDEVGAVVESLDFDSLRTTKDVRSEDSGGA